MSHPEQQTYCVKVAARFPLHFCAVRALDVGSLDINGCNQHLFRNSLYVGMDVGHGKNVDVVGLIHEAKATAFDTIICTEMLEHDPHWRESLLAMVRLLRIGGLLLLTCATIGRGEHGTKTHGAEYSPLTQSKWPDYYGNRTEDDLRSVWDMAIWREYEFETDTVAHDLRFWGIKR